MAVNSTVLIANNRLKHQRICWAKLSTVPPAIGTSKSPKALQGIADQIPGVVIIGAHLVTTASRVPGLICTPNWVDTDRSGLTK